MRFHRAVRGCVWIHMGFLRRSEESRGVILNGVGPLYPVS